MSGASTPTFHPNSAMGPPPMMGGPYSKLREPYPAWANDSIPLSKEEIEDVFIDLANKVSRAIDAGRERHSNGDRRLSRWSRQGRAAGILLTGQTALASQPDRQSRYSAPALPPSQSLWRHSAVVEPRYMPRLGTDKLFPILLFPAHSLDSSATTCATCTTTS